MAEAAPAAPGPTAFVAVTWKVYALPLSRPVTVHEVPVVVQVCVELATVTVYEVIGEPLEAGAVHDTRAAVFDTEATVVTTGADGAARDGLNGEEATDGGLVPARFTAMTDTV